MQIPNLCSLNISSANARSGGRTEVIVGGGGVSGTATAIALRRTGSDVTPYETHPDPAGQVGSFSESGIQRTAGAEGARLPGPGPAGRFRGDHSADVVRHREAAGGSSARTAVGGSAAQYMVSGRLPGRSSIPARPDPPTEAYTASRASPAASRPKPARSTWSSRAAAPFSTSRLRTEPCGGPRRLPIPGHRTWPVSATTGCSGGAGQGASMAIEDAASWPGHSPRPTRPEEVSPNTTGSAEH
ncbi:NAD(P)-binding protein [Rhodococcus sp. WB9]|uniref:NAD(P)-binding protein n=1 Tax=Rhodococcus sp. WB9 TaxID=2594007 RepID=UPI0037CA4FDB